MERSIDFSKPRTQVMLLLLLITLGGIIRLYGLEIQSFWNDELSSWRRSSFDHLIDVIDTSVQTDVHPPGYQILVYYVLRYIGDTQAALRFPSAIAGILSIPVIYLLGLQLYSYREGLIAASLMGILWCPVYYSQEARGYSLLLLFTLMAAYLWLDILRNFTREKTPPYYMIVAYIAAAITASYLHYYGAFFIALQGLLGIFIIIRKVRALRHLFVIYGSIFLAYLPWVPSMVSHFQSDRGSWIPEPVLSTFLSYLGFFFNKPKPLLYIVLALYGLLLLRSLYNFSVTRGKRCESIITSPTMLLTLWLVVPYTIAYFISITFKPVLYNRFLIISLPAAYLLLARALTQLPIRRMGRIFITLSLIGLFIFHLLFIHEYYSRPHKAQFREAVGYALEQAHHYEDSAIIGNVWYPEFLNYYFEKGGSQDRVDIIASQREDIPLVSEFIQTETPNYIWLISAHQSPSPELLDFLEKKFTMLDHQALYNADVWLFENR